MRILLFGRNGQVGWELQRSLLTLGPVHAIGRDQCDLTDAQAIRDMVRRVSPDLIVNAAAYTAVDRAEAQPDLAHAVNTIAPMVLATEAESLGIGLVHYSTDYVFDGTKATPYTEDDETGPISAYGRSKLEGEIAVRQSCGAHLILRTSWVYSRRGQNFLRTMFRLMRERHELSIVADQWGAPTWARTIADATASMLSRTGSGRMEVTRTLKARGGTFHLTASGESTWFEFASFLRDNSVDELRTLRSLVPIATAQYPTAARRPSNSALSTEKLRDTWQIHLPHWSETARLCLEECPDGVRLAGPADL